MALQDRFQILTYDARAQGRSDLGRQQLSLERHTFDLEGLLKYLGIEKTHLAGVSHGAKVALAYAAKRPEQVDRLILSSVGIAPTCRGKLFLKSWLETLKGRGLEAMVWASLPVVFGERFLKRKERVLGSIVNAMVKRNRKDAIAAHLEAMAAYLPISHFASHVSAPTLVISASEDPLVTEEASRKLATLCNGRHRQFVGIGHSIPSESPELFNETLLEFLNKARPHLR